MTDRHAFDRPLRLHLGEEGIEIATAEQAALVLADVRWPGERGPAHREAHETCLKVMDGHRSVEDARAALLRAAEEAGLRAEG